jgi:carboxypeptidase family protein
MKRLLPILTLALGLSACGGGSSPTAPAPVTPTPTTFTLSGTVTSSQNGAGISGASVKIGDSTNAGRSTTTDGSGHYSLAGLSRAGFTVNFTAVNFFDTSAGVTLSDNQTLSAQMAPTPLFTASGSGDNVFSIPTSVRTVRITGDYPGRTSNFIVKIGGSLVVNELVGTDWGQPHFAGTYLTTGGTVQITNSSGVTWSFTEVR